MRVCLKSTLFPPFLDSVRAWKQRNQLGEFDVNKHDQAVEKSHKAAANIQVTTLVDLVF
jgi:hypothetical protein